MLNPIALLLLILFTRNSRSHFIQMQFILKRIREKTGLHKIVVFPALSSPNIKILISLDPKRAEKSFENTNPIENKNKIY